MRMTTSRVIAVAVAAVLGLAGCGGDEGTEQDGATEESAEPTPEERLAAARATPDEAGSVHLVLESEGVPEDTDGITAAEGVGTMEPPAFEGDFTGRLQGLQAQVPVVAVEGDLYVELPFAPDYVRTDPADFNAPDPAQLFTPDEGITSLLPATEGVEFGDTSRAGREVVQTITGTLPGDAVHEVLNLGDTEGSFEVTYGVVEEGDQLRTVELVGPFFGGAEATYRLTLDQYGEPVEITAP